MDKHKDKKKHLFVKGHKETSIEKVDITVVDSKMAKKAVFAAGVGNAMEWFDFGIYSYLAVILGKVFFPDLSGTTQLVYTFATFAVAFLVRPFGGMFFGMLGDRLGRKKVLSITLVIMALSTLSIGLIPSYASIGVTASVLLLVARLIQGFSTGGEYSGAMTFIAESTPDKKRGFMSSGLEVGTLVGYIAGAGLVTLLTFILGDDKMLAWGWRVPFLISAPIGFIGLYLRVHLEETPAFKAMEEEQNEERDHVSMKDIFVYHKRPLLICIALVCFYNIIDYMVLSYMPSHLSAVLGYGDMKGLLLILIVMFIMIPIVLIMGYISDRVGIKKIILSGLISMFVLALPAFYLIGSGNNWLVFLGLMVLAIILASFQGTMPALLPSLFFTDVRYGGLAITYNISASLFGGTTPLVISGLIGYTASRMVPAYYLMVAAIVGLVVVVFFLKETSGKALRGSPPAVEEKSEVQEVYKETKNELWWEEERVEIDKKMEES